LVETTSQRVALAAGVQVDVQHLTRSAHEIIKLPDSAAVPVGFGDLVEPLSQEMLPDWSEDWISADRERWDQVRLHALETLAKRLLGAEQHLSALEVALTAVQIDPLRESAHRAVVEVHIAEGNSASAIRHYRHYRGLLQRELGVAPTYHMEQLIHSLAMSDRIN
jgi:DNA-binding SARP family transcriptional activator